jgi:RNA ligase
MIKKITTMEHIQDLVKSGFTDWKKFGNVKTIENDGLILFTYTKKAYYKGEWNFFERVSRGLILNKETGEIIARPFDKFFNWGEGGRYSTASIGQVVDKIDGSLGILYKHKGEYKIATKGSFDSEQALWATDFLHKNYNINSLNDEMTLLFEIVYPDNKIVVDYGNKQDLILLDIRNRFTGDYYAHYTVEFTANSYGFSLPTTYHYDSVYDIIFDAQDLDKDKEGFVVKFWDGQWFKIKGALYVKEHKRIDFYRMVGKSKFVARSMADGTISHLIRKATGTGLEFELAYTIGSVEKKAENIFNKVEDAFQEAPKTDRKTFALWVKKHHPQIAVYLFLAWDNKEIYPAIYKREF